MVVSEEPVPPCPRASATIVVLRDGDAGLEVLLVRRSPAARVLAGVWVFPGGGLARDEGRDEQAYRAAAVRELAEEADVRGLDPGDLVPFSRWVTPDGVAARYDTRFFLAPAPAGARARADGQECVDAAWFTPLAALDAADAGGMALVRPTLTTLRHLTPFATARELLAHARGSVLLPVPPAPGSGERERILLPDDPRARR
jgi:ADP-ribose pyrophosphatase YjhB (NUDIX family)